MINVIGNNIRKLKFDSRIKSDRKFDLYIYQNEINDEIFDEINKLNLWL